VQPGGSYFTCVLQVSTVGGEFPVPLWSAGVEKSVDIWHILQKNVHRADTGIQETVDKKSIFGHLSTLHFEKNGLKLGYSQFYPHYPLQISFPAGG